MNINRNLIYLLLVLTVISCNKPRTEHKQLNQVTNSSVIKQDEKVINKVIKKVFVIPAKCKYKDTTKHGKIFISYQDGEKKQLTSHELGTEPKIAKDKKTIGILIGEHIESMTCYNLGLDSDNNPYYSMSIEIYKEEKFIKTIKVGWNIWEWGFWNNSTQIAINYGPEHSEAFYSLYDIETGKVIAEYKESDFSDNNDKPDWITKLYSK